MIYGRDLFKRDDGITRNVHPTGEHMPFDETANLRIPVKTSQRGTLQVLAKKQEGRQKPNRDGGYSQRHLKIPFLRGQSLDGLVA